MYRSKMHKNLTSDFSSSTLASLQAVLDNSDVHIYSATVTSTGNRYLCIIRKSIFDPATSTKDVAKVRFYNVLGAPKYVSGRKVRELWRFSKETIASISSNDMVISLEISGEEEYNFVLHDLRELRDSREGIVCANQEGSSISLDNIALTYLESHLSNGGTSITLGAGEEFTIPQWCHDYTWVDKNSVMETVNDALSVTPYHAFMLRSATYFDYGVVIVFGGFSDDTAKDLAEIAVSNYCDGLCGAKRTIRNSQPVTRWNLYVKGIENVWDSKLLLCVDTDASGDGVSVFKEEKTVKSYLLERFGIKD